jgi:hypothetical protein
MEIGRAFTAQEDIPHGPRLVVISDGLWRRRFGTDRSLVGKAILLGGEPHVVIGVLGPSFSTDSPADIWLPLQAASWKTARPAALAEQDDGSQGKHCTRRLKGKALGSILPATEGKVEILDNSYERRLFRAGHDQDPAAGMHYPRRMLQNEHPEIMAYAEQQETIKCSAGKWRPPTRRRKRRTREDSRPRSWKNNYA